MKKALIPISIIVIFLLCICCSTGVVLFSNGMVEGAKGMNDAILNDVCMSHGRFDEDEYSKWFAEEFVNEVDIMQVKGAVEAAFPDDYDCSAIYKNSNIVSMIFNGEGYGVQFQNGVTTAEVTLPYYSKLGGYHPGTVKIKLIKIDGNWKIYKIFSE